MPPIPRPDARDARLDRGAHDAPGAIGSGPSRGPARIVVLGDLMLDVVLAPARPLESGTDVPGRVALVQGGSAATTARWLGRLGARVEPHRRGRSRCGRPGAGRGDPRRRRHRRASRASPAPGPAGSASSSSPAASAASWPTAAPPTCSRRPTCEPPGSPAPMRSTCRSTRCSASRSGSPAGGRSSSRAERGATVSVDLASIGPLLAGGRRAARGAHRGGRARTSCSRPRPRPRRSSAAAASTGCSTSRRPRSSSAGPKGATVLPGSAASGSAFEVATEQLVGDRHDRRRRRVRCRVPRRLVRRRARRSVAAGLAPARGARRPSGGGPPAVDAAGRSWRSAEAATLRSR